MEKTIAEIVNDANNATILGEGPNGEKYVSFEDFTALTSMVTLEAQSHGQVTATDIPEINPDGSYAGTSPKYIALSIDTLYMNRAKWDDDHIWVVTDWWCIQEQKNNRVPFKQVPCFVLKRDGKKLSLERATYISDAEFIADFTHELGNRTMAAIFPLIQMRGPEKEELI